MYICIMTEEENIETQIVMSAKEMFLTKGFKSVTMDDLASSMGMSKKTIYTYFKTKNDLVNEVANNLSETISAGIDYICSLNHNPIEEFYVINDFVQDNLKKEDSSPIYQLQKYYPTTHIKLIEKQFEISHSCICRNLKIGIKSGLYRNDINLDFIARLFFSTAVNIKDQEMFPKNEFPPHQIMNEHLEYHIHGISTKKGLQKLEHIKQKRNG